MVKAENNCVCQTCGIGFHVKPSVIKKGFGKFHSIKCKAKSQLGREPGNKIPEHYIKRICLQCGIEFTYVYRPSHGPERGFFHNRSCLAKFFVHINKPYEGTRGKIPWNKGIPGLQEEKSPNWKGIIVTYRALHMWVTKNKGKASSYICVCGSSKGMEWSNISGKYLRDLNDYEPLCRSCHRKKDAKGKNFFLNFTPTGQRKNVEI